MDKLGARLRKSAVPAGEDLRLLDLYERSFLPACSGMVWNGDTAPAGRERGKLRLTHGNYFYSLTELADKLLRAAS